MSLLASSALAGPPDWAWQNPKPQGSDLLGVAYGNGLFVAVGKEGSILTSPVGKNWTPRDAHTMYALRSIAYGGGLLLANLLDVTGKSTGRGTAGDGK